jgi:hypothetical protein
MDSRLELHEIFCNILESRNAYYQPPASVKMKYPAIVYSRKKIDNSYANNLVYKQSRAYEVTVIDEDPDSEIVKKVSELPACTHDRYFTSDNLNHDVFTLYY